VTITAEGVETEAELSCLRSEAVTRDRVFCSAARAPMRIVGLLKAQRGADFVAPADFADKSALVA